MPTREMVDMAREKVVVLTLDRDLDQAPAIPPSSGLCARRAADRDHL
jgi:hypothetical protein